MYHTGVGPRGLRSTLRSALIARLFGKLWTSVLDSPAAGRASSLAILCCQRAADRAAHTAAVQYLIFRHVRIYFVRPGKDAAHNVF
jgi:hypothetical protein